VAASTVNIPRGWKATGRAAPKLLPYLYLRMLLAMIKVKNNRCPKPGMRPRKADRAGVAENIAAGGQRFHEASSEGGVDRWPSAGVSGPGVPRTQHIPSIPPFRALLRRRRPVAASARGAGHRIRPAERRPPGRSRERTPCDIILRLPPSLCTARACPERRRIQEREAPDAIPQA